MSLIRLSSYKRERRYPEMSENLCAMLQAVWNVELCFKKTPYEI